jgi:hypothetical protein
MVGLPRLFKTRLETIPNRVPYLLAQPELVEKWRQALAARPTAFNVGLVWAGNPDHKNDHNRSLRLAQYEHLANIPRVRFYSLQKGPPAEQAKFPPMGMDFVDESHLLADMIDTAALISNLDLVITVDTSVAHLAGALGKPVWTLINVIPDWRWLLNRTDSPWYPTMKLYRQTKIKDWTDPLAKIESDLRDLVR